MARRNEVELAAEIDALRVRIAAVEGRPLAQDVIGRRLRERHLRAWMRREAKVTT